MHKDEEDRKREDYQRHPRARIASIVVSIVMIIAIIIVLIVVL